MIKTKSTKRALILSVIALLVCVSMFIGSTFAWFTDTANTGINKIVSGNLDVELYYATPADYAAGTWTEVEPSSKLFKDGALYEPGYTELVYLKVKNVGSLALKYDMNINYTEKAGINVHGDKFNLSDYISARVIFEGEFANMNLRDNVPYFDAGIMKFPLGVVLSEFAGSSSDTMLGWNDTALEPGEEAEVAVALWMDTEVGNEANYMTSDDASNPTKYQPSIDLGIGLVATQYTYEEDSFGADYDKDAAYPELPAAKISNIGATTVPDADGKLTLSDGTVLEIENNTYSSYSESNPAALDQTYVLTAPETAEEALSSPYRYWNADFVVSFDKEVTASEGTGIVGNYGNWGWIGFDSSDFGVASIPADIDFRLFESRGIYMNYYELCRDVENFICGAFNTASENKGITMTVEVRLYETEDYVSGNNSHNSETGIYKVIETLEYTF